MATDEVRTTISTAVASAIDTDDLQKQLVGAIAQTLGTDASVDGIEKEVSDRLLSAYEEKLASALQQTITTAVQSYMQEAMTSLMTQLSAQIEQEVSTAMQSAMGQMASSMSSAMHVDESAIASAFHFNMDEKELSEHTMLVDLGRNDLGRISKIGSVHVESFMNVLRFSHVMHIGSTVKSTIADGRDALDAIDSILPAGTLSGAPKIEACRIIAELEGSKRGIYGGAIGYLDFSGNLDTCIGIRLAYKKGGVVCVQSGAGIVADSDPEREHQECLNKARAVVEALHEAEGGLA